MSSTSAIQLLPDAVINQIAAGEVVERPAAVLKELVENSLDAGATRIVVEITDGGRRLIRVRDDGVGMDRNNALLAIERHATSKLRELQDLDSIRTMGFRGEALAAISAVSQFTLITNRADAVAGTEILIFGGRIQDVRDAGAPPGTEISVRNLFFNVPARRKFMRTAQTEFNHARQAFLLEALANPGVAFILRADDEELYHLQPTDSLVERIRDLYGEEVTRHLRPLDFGNGIVEVGGYAGLPPFSRLDREWQVIFVNGRPAGSPVLNFAVQTAYRNVLAGGRFAPIFLRLELPQDLVDVNIHPAKKEVRFRRPTEVRDVVIEAIRMAISGPELPSARPPAFDPQPVATRPPAAIDLSPAQAPPPPAPAVKPSMPPAAPPVAVVQPALDWTPPPAPVPEATGPAASPWGDYRLLDRIRGGYVVLETDEGLVLMDPRSAHERVLYERLMIALEEGRVPSQGLLPPIHVQPSPTQTQALRKHMELLQKMGFGLAEFGSGSFLVDALPVWLAGSEPGPLISDIADGLMQGGKGSASEWAGSTIAMAAGRQAVSLQQELTDPELHALVKALSQTEMPYMSPRGKPTIILFSTRELNRKFGRE
ncbi:MAG: DNA mismatch repair endonuclease MutL [Lentisphaerae bacterium]|jgi:DNA mismatch repair protein MutL|nr:DNA mismatch repair endonuclease MutL [Lentisphaerota bacterium]